MLPDFLEIIKPLAGDSITTMAAIILILPLVTFVVLIFVGNNLPRKGDWFATGIMGLCALLSFIVFFNVWGNQEEHHVRFDWVNLGSGIGSLLPLKFTLGLMVDSMSAIMLVVVTFICFLVHLFSIDYMHGEEHYNRYFAYLGIFTFSMLGIVLADNLLLTYIFWELVGLSSYLLIGFWFKKEAPIRANKKAFLINRIGDIGMFIGMLILFLQFSTLDLSALKILMTESTFEQGKWIITLSSGVKGQVPVTHSLDAFWLTVAGICLFCGCVGKSAQFPLQVWLPDAMEGPTPVSSLIHAATMVAAGVYMVGRIFALLSVDALTVIAFIGMITAFMAAYSAMTQTDLKRVLAFSTISQLGYMVMGLGVGAYDAALFHLVTHAFFKCLLFLTAASVIHAMHHVEHELHHHGKHVHFDPQDMRIMGGLRKKMPVTFWTYFVGTMALAGIPFFSGFLSKDAIIVGGWGWADEMSGNGSNIYYLVPVVGFLTAAMTAFYMGRQMFMTFFGDFRLEKLSEDAKGAFEHVHDATFWMKPALVCLALFTIAPVFVPSLNPVNLTNGHSSWFMHTISIPKAVTPDNNSYISKETLSGISKEHPTSHAPAVTPRQLSIIENAHHRHHAGLVLSLIIGIGSILLAYVFYGSYTKLGPLSKEKIQLVHARITSEESIPYKISYNKWYMDEIYHVVFVQPTVYFSEFTSWFDAKVIDGVVNLVARLNVILGNLSGWFDRWVVDGAVNLSAYLSGRLGSVTRRFQNGDIQLYFIYMLAGVLLVFVFKVIW